MIFLAIHVYLASLQCLRKSRISEAKKGFTPFDRKKENDILLHTYTYLFFHHKSAIIYSDMLDYISLCLLCYVLNIVQHFRS